MAVKTAAMARQNCHWSLDDECRDESCDDCGTLPEDLYQKEPKVEAVVDSPLSVLDAHRARSCWRLQFHQPVRSQKGNFCRLQLVAGIILSR